MVQIFVPIILDDWVGNGMGTQIFLPLAGVILNINTYILIFSFFIIINITSYILNSYLLFRIAREKAKQYRLVFLYKAELNRVS